MYSRKVEGVTQFLSKQWAVVTDMECLCYAHEKSKRKFGRDNTNTLYSIRPCMICIYNILIPYWKVMTVTNTKRSIYIYIYISLSLHRAFCI